MNYLTVEFAIDTHDKIIDSSGGRMGVMNRGHLDLILNNMQNDDYYPTLCDKLTYLFYAVNKNHCFTDGNKRASIILSSYFLFINDYKVLGIKFITVMENIAVDIASNVYGKDFLFELFKSFLTEDEFNMDLQLRMIEYKENYVDPSI